MSGLFDVAKETILITGASQGLGRQFPRVLSSHGAAVVLAARQVAKLKSLEQEIRGKGGRAAAVEMDVMDTASVARGIDAAEAALGPISVLINNAGIAIEKLALEQTEADFHAVVGANLKGFKRIPQSRVGAESDLDGAILLLASRASRYMTGSVVTVDGGFLLT